MLLGRIPPNGTRKSPGQVGIISRRGQNRKFSPGRGLEKRLGSRFYQESAKAEKGNAVKGNAVRIRNVRVPHEGHCYHVRSAGAFNEEIIAFAL
jgi:hypothetical protein